MMLKAAQFAAAFGLVIDQAELLNCYMLDTKQTYSLLNQFAIAKDNIQELKRNIIFKCLCRIKSCD